MVSFPCPFSLNSLSTPFSRLCFVLSLVYNHIVMRAVGIVLFWAEFLASLHYRVRDRLESLVFFWYAALRMSPTRLRGQIFFPFSVVSSQSGSLGHLPCNPVLVPYFLFAKSASCCFSVSLRASLTIKVYESCMKQDAFVSVWILKNTLFFKIMRWGWGVCAQLGRHQ